MSDLIDFSFLRTEEQLRAELTALRVQAAVLESAVNEAQRIRARITQLKREGVVPLKEYRQLQRLLDRV